MLPRGFEPRLPGRKPGVLAICTKGATVFNGRHKGIEPFPQAPQACMQTIYTNVAIAVQPGVEPESPGRQPGMLAINTTDP